MFLCVYMSVHMTTFGNLFSFLFVGSRDWIHVVRLMWHASLPIEHFCQIGIKYCFLKIYFNYFKICVCLCVWLYTHNFRCQCMPEEGLRFPRNRSREGCEVPLWVLGSKLWSSRGVALELSLQPPELSIFMITLHEQMHRDAVSELLRIWRSSDFSKGICQCECSSVILIF